MAWLVRKIRFSRCTVGLLTVSLALVLLSSVSYCRAEQNGFPLKDGDVWVMAGDSITAQHLHTNYFEAFCYARFPGLTFHFRNSGVGGDTIPKLLARFNWDVEAWKPTVVSVELGMNDSGAGPDSTPAYISGMGNLAERIRKAGARPVIFSSSPVNDGTTTANLKGRNLTIDKYSTALVEFAAKQNIPYADQFHALLDVWGQNNAVENLFRFSDSVRAASANAAMPGKQILAQWLEEWKKSGMEKRGVNLTGNSIHPGPAGQVTMCAVLLKALNAPGLVSKAAINCSGSAAGVTEEVKCRVTNLKQENNGISFDRLDESLPMPVPDGCQAVSVILPSLEDLSRWVLTVKNLKTGNYDVSMDGMKIATVSSDELGKGWNMGLLEKGPVADQCRQILALVSKKEQIVGQWRAESRRISSLQPGGDTNTALDELSKQVIEADKAIKDAAQPKIHHFVIVPANPAN